MGQVVPIASEPVEARVEHLCGHVCNVLTQMRRKVSLAHVIAETHVELVRSLMVEELPLCDAVSRKELLLGYLGVLDLGRYGACEVLLYSDLHCIVLIIFLILLLDVFIVCVPRSHYQLSRHIKQVGQGVVAKGALALAVYQNDTPKSYFGVD